MLAEPRRVSGLTYELYIHAVPCVPPYQSSFSYQYEGYLRILSPYDIEPTCITFSLGGPDEKDAFLRTFSKAQTIEGRAYVSQGKCTKVEHT